MKQWKREIAVLLSLPLAVVAVVPSAVSAQQVSPDEGEYALLDDSPRDFTNLNAEAVRPLAMTPDGRDLYALNTHASQVVWFGGEEKRELGRFATPLFPVSIAVLDDELLVVCAGTQCLVRINRTNGKVEQLLSLPSEPGDIVVDLATRRAFVACAGVDRVVEVDLDSFSILKSYFIRSKRPRFLSLEPDGSVLVTPSVSGNNTTIVLGQIRDLSDPNIAKRGGLPDMDLFRLMRGDSRFRGMLRGMGSLLFAHGRNPATGEYWMLNVESLNADPARQGEPEVRGDFARNRVSIANLPAGTAGTRLRTVDLDDVDPSAAVRYEAARSVSMPYNLVFSSKGLGFVTAPSTDKVAVLDAQGGRLAELNLPAGAIPRATLLDEAAGIAWVHAWGSNRLFGFALDRSTTQPEGNEPVFERDLGLDPTPPSVRAGRRVFYDASNSANRRFTCGHCHPGGGADALAWDLSNRPLDDKGPLVTQTLFGLESTFPYHWRGERSLRDFNGAFHDLLGNAQPLPDDVFGQLESFLFSLQPAANPRQDITRKLVRTAGQPDPILGQQVYTTTPATAGRTCTACHALPTGSSSDVILQEFSLIAARTHFVAPSFGNGSLILKNQVTVSLNALGALMEVPVLGVGLGARGGISTLESFVSGFPGVGLALAPALAAFLERFDHGLSPAAHAGWLYSSDSPLQTETSIETILLEQARRGWIDVVAWGTVGTGERERSVRWLYDPASGLFRSDDPLIDARSWEELRAMTRRGAARHVVQGVPPGNGLRFGIDFDGDGRVNGGHVARRGLTSPRVRSSRDRTPPVFRVEPRLLWINSTVAKLTFETDEPTTWEIRFQTTVGDERILQSRDPARVHTAVLQDLEQSTEDVVLFEYFGDVTVRDAGGNATTVSLPPDVITNFMTTRSWSPVIVIGDRKWERHEWDVSSGQLDARAVFQINRKPGSGLDVAAKDHVLIARVLVNGNVHSLVETSGPTSFEIDGTPYRTLSGPFLLSAPSRVDDLSEDGTVRLSFSVSGLLPGDDIILHVVAIPSIDPATYDPGAPSFGRGATLDWSLPDTRPHLRQLQIAIPDPARHP